MNSRWQISAGELFELLRPAAFALSALLSAWVLASARQRGFRPAVTAAWTIFTFFFPPIVLPIYLIVRAASRRERVKEATLDMGEGVEESSPIAPRGAPLKWRSALPIGYVAVALSLIALYFYLDGRTVDAHLARANYARLASQRETSIREYSEALRLEDDPHTHNLLGIELAAAERFEEALAEYRAAERGGEPDEELSYRIAAALDALNRHAEAVLEYQKFLSGHPCAHTLPDLRCELARARARTAPSNEAR